MLEQEAFWFGLSFGFGGFLALFGFAILGFACREVFKKRR